jgi:phospholipid/cholesterol/gamma-HCH transport system substrate-binding protein
VTGKYLKVGIAVIVIGVASYLLLSMYGQHLGGAKDQLNSYFALFRDATGLVDKSNVQIAGLNVGEITGRSVQERKWKDAAGVEHRQVMARIDFKLLKKYTPVYDNAIVFKKQSSLLGGYYLEVDPGSHESPAPGGAVRFNAVIPNGGEITHVEEVTSIGDIMSQVNELVPILKGILEDVKAMTQGPIKESAQRVQQILDQNAEVLHHLIVNIDRISGDVQAMTGRSREDVVATIRNLRSITEAVRSFVGTGEPGKAGGTLGETAGNVNSALTQLRAAIEKLDHSLGNVAAMTDTARQEKLAENVSATAANLEEITSDAGGFIRDVTKLKTIVSLREEFNFNAQTLKTYLGIEIRPRPDKYYLLEVIDDPRGSVKRTRTITQTNDPNKPPVTLEDKTEISEAFRFSFQFGKRLDWLGLRFGIKESTGGVGSDLYFNRDRVVVSADLFDFKSNVWPRFKVLAAWEFFRYMYVVGGVDDLFNEDSRKGTGGGRDYFVGAQLRFNDEDLKSLLLFGGSAIAGAASSH